MKNKFLSKLICTILIFIIALSTPLSVFASMLNAAPVIYVGDMIDNALYKNPNKINSEPVFDMNSSEFTGAITKIVAGLVYSQFSEVRKAIPTVSDAIKELMNPLLCAPNGVPQNSNIGPWYYDKPISNYRDDSIYTDDLASLVKSSSGFVSENKIYFFSYDWRIDPLSSAKKLYDFIEHVKEKTSSNKVSILTVGYGGVVVNSYMYTYKEHAEANLSSCVFYNCALMGNSVISDFMIGKIAKTILDDGTLLGSLKTVNGEDRGNAFFDYIEDDHLGIFSDVFKNLLGDGTYTELFGNLFLTIFTTIVKGQDGHKELGKAYNKFALNADSVIYNDFLREYLRNMPGLWALVTKNDYDDAVEFLFEDEIINEELNSKIINYRNVINDVQNTLTSMKSSGVNICIVANYGFQIIPVTVSYKNMSDGVETLEYASVGAMTLDNSTSGNHYNHCINKNHKHRSPDNDIDSSYCILPENTWFIKDLYHGSFSDESVSDFLVWLLSGVAQRFVNENRSYTQYLKYNSYSKKLTPYSEPDEATLMYKYGDIDDDGKVTASDARLVLRMAVGLEPTPKELVIVADVNGDSKITAADAREILRYAVGLTTRFEIQ